MESGEVGVALGDSEGAEWETESYMIDCMRRRCRR